MLADTIYFQVSTNLMGILCLGESRCKRKKKVRGNLLEINIGDNCFL